MEDAKHYVLSRFPGAGVRKVGEIYLLEGIPGLRASGTTEHYAWASAAEELSDPALEASRKQFVQGAVLEAFASLGGLFNQPMALAKCLEQRGFAASEAISAIEEVVLGGALVRSDTGSIGLC
jgi:hypothetical protein